MTPRPQAPAAGASSRASGGFPLPVVRPPEPPPAWILARAAAQPMAIGQPVTPGGVEEGYAEGLRRAESTILAERRRVVATLESLSSLRDRLLSDNEARIVDLALAIARELALRSVDRDRDVAARLASAALEELGRSTHVVLRISPTDRAEIDAWMAAPPERAPRPMIVLVEDEALGPGDVIAETDLGRVDARLETRLAQVARAIREGEGGP